MTDLDLTEAIERANEAIAEQGGFWLDGDVVIAAIVPVIERQVRERIAADIEARAMELERGHTPPWAGHETRMAARIARGGAS